jgi:hypothetical protein
VAAVMLTRQRANSVAGLGHLTWCMVMTLFFGNCSLLCLLTYLILLAAEVM